MAFVSMIESPLLLLRHGLANSDTCKRCNTQRESIIHLLRDCPKSKEVGQRLIPNSKYAWFFNLNSESWMKFNVEDGQCGKVYISRLCGSYGRPGMQSILRESFFWPDKCRWLC